MFIMQDLAGGPVDIVIELVPLAVHLCFEFNFPGGCSLIEIFLSLLFFDIGNIVFFLCMIYCNTDGLGS